MFAILITDLIAQLQHDVQLTSLYMKIDYLICCYMGLQEQARPALYLLLLTRYIHQKSSTLWCWRYDTTMNYDFLMRVFLLLLLLL